MIDTVEIKLETSGHCDVVDVTGLIHGALQKNGMREGQVLIFVPGSTAGVTTVEFEPGLVKDLHEFFQKIVPEGPEYHHHDTWGDDNGSSHVRAALLKPSLTVPFSNGKLLLGTWQQVVFVDFDTRPRHRSVVLQFTGEYGPAN